MPSRIPQPLRARALTFCVALLTALIAVGPAAAQQVPPDSSAEAPSSSFEALTVVLSGTANVNRETFHEFWSPRLGAGASVTAPFYGGRVQAGLALHRYDGTQIVQDAVSVQLPSITAGHFTLGWGPRLRLTRRLESVVAARLGTYFMHFSNEQEALQAGGLTNETELTLGAQARLSFRFAGPWAAVASASYQRVFTNRRIDLWYVSAGISRRFGTPRWLRNFLQ